MPLPLRVDFDAAQLRAVARRTKDGPQARRLLALAAIYDGCTRTEASLIDRKALGRMSRPERKCIGTPEQNYITDNGSKAPVRAPCCASVSPRDGWPVR